MGQELKQKILREIVVIILSLFTIALYLNIGAVFYAGYQYSFWYPDRNVSMLANPPLIMNKINIPVKIFEKAYNNDVKQKSLLLHKNYKSFKSYLLTRIKMMNYYQIFWRLFVIIFWWVILLIVFLIILLISGIGSLLVVGYHYLLLGLHFLSQLVFGKLLLKGLSDVEMTIRGIMLFHPFVLIILIVLGIIWITRRRRKRNIETNLYDDDIDGD